MKVNTVLRFACRGLGIFAVLAGLSSSGWCASIAGFSGPLQFIALPASLQPGAFESDEAVSVFQEQGDTILASDLPYDAGSAGLYNSTASLTPGIIEAGTEISDVLVHSDPVRSSGVRFTGSITFNGNILGVIGSGSTLSATDGTLGIPGIDYAGSDPWRGFELLPGQDSFTISSDLHTLSFSAMTWGNIDELRIITAASRSVSVAPSVPEPGTGVLLSLGLAAFAWSRWGPRGIKS